ncbi:MAG: hypothetical protein M1827_002276 [Pycnora praestabilis]|nr:MAG: hypothetical protein M1827_002276 [Pycnora praestabilis]
MTRTLPWLKDAKRLQDARSIWPVKRQRLVSPSSDTDIATVAASPRINANARNPRTPSTSPPPDPPKEEFMLEGLDQDDIYVMVEDEFLGIAKTFTQHLHHAEYVRLKNMAKSQNASTINKISRPVDSRTLMREDLKRQKVAKKKSQLQKRTVQGMMAKAGNTEQDGDDSDSEEDKDDDPWIGTTLQGLMTSPRKSQTSLSRLSTVKSSTRAAAGYRKAHSSPLRDVGSTTLLPYGVPPKSRQSPMEEATASEEDDDLDAPTNGKSMKRRGRDHSSQKPTESSVPQRQKQESIFRQFAHPKDHPKGGGFTTHLPSTPSTPSRIQAARFSSSAASPSSPSSRKSAPSFESINYIPNRAALPIDVSLRMKNKMAEFKAAKAKKQRDEKRKSTLLNEIPMFLG